MTFFQNRPPPAEPKRLAGHAFSTRLDRDAAMDAAFAAIFARWQRPSSGEVVENRRVPLMATYCGPGGGKSFFCDEVMACHEHDVERFIRNATPALSPDVASRFRDALRNALRLGITFNDFMPILLGNQLESSHESAVSARMLFSYVMHSRCVVSLTRHTGCVFTLLLCISGTLL